MKLTESLKPSYSLETAAFNGLTTSSNFNKAYLRATKSPLPISRTKESIAVISTIMIVDYKSETIIDKDKLKSTNYKLTTSSIVDKLDFSSNDYRTNIGGGGSLTIANYKSNEILDSKVIGITSADYKIKTKSIKVVATSSANYKTKTSIGNYLAKTTSINYKTRTKSIENFKPTTINAMSKKDLMTATNTDYKMKTKGAGRVERTSTDYEQKMTKSEFTMKTKSINNKQVATTGYEVTNTQDATLKTGDPSLSPGHVENSYIKSRNVLHTISFDTRLALKSSISNVKLTAENVLTDKTLISDIVTLSTNGVGIKTTTTRYAQMIKSSKASDYLPTSSTHQPKYEIEEFHFKIAIAGDVDKVTINQRLNQAFIKISYHSINECMNQ